ncbi:uncharacterized protein UMAG_11570 [Mycosarcoma maydis]|uniref:Protein-lysine N-methyltransferase EFM6 n=1 Tax=Mycosarcoma maydis TaxID=5270 RepID=A0A0D1E1Y5_MYCMD|nr:uncharacterized protein UMAG_11570 [Ustilago maydis 521]KIS70139.1 hypothetical protein UMAG_11570 [Ustilago maydis 521]|eukprot:XP_011388391.1 hypothetical protein UMAG_11570 [Ustilago maydis 521]
MPSTQAADDVRAELEREEELDLVDPLRHFLAVDDDEQGQLHDATHSASHKTADVREPGSNTKYRIVPHQIESIIDRRTSIRYYCDLSRRPELIDDAVQSDAHLENVRWWDVHLKLDMTSGCGGKIWPAAEVLGAYIAGKYSCPADAPEDRTPTSNQRFNNHNFDWRNKSIIELGSGTGLVGYLVHALGLSNCRIWVTDQDVMLPLMRDNLALNFHLDPNSPCSSIAYSPDQSGFVQVAELNWGQRLPEFATTHPPDVLLLADCVYLESAFQPLIDTMVHLSTQRTEILFCYQKRRKADKRFFALLKRSFVFENVQDDDADRCREYQRQGTQLLRIRKK